jgi:hypothetical protein
MTDDTRANAAAQAVPRTEAGKRLLEHVPWDEIALDPSIVAQVEADAASLVPAPDLDVETLAEAMGVMLVTEDGELVESLAESAVRIAAEYARLRAAASPTAHSAPRSEALRETVEQMGAHIDAGYEMVPIATVAEWRRALASTDRDASPATSDARQEDQP